MSKVFNMVSGGGGKNISSIIITGLESTDTITCTKDGKSYTATWDATAQHWEIIGLPLGTFTVTATNGNTTTETVLIDVAGVYEIEMTHFYIGFYLEHKANANDTVSVTTSDNVIATVRIATTTSAYTYGHFRIYNADGTEYALKNGDEILFSYNQSYTPNGMNTTEAYIQYSSSKTNLISRQNVSNYLYTATSSDESGNAKFRIGLNSYDNGASSTIELTKLMLNGVNIPFKS